MVTVESRWRAGVTTANRTPHGSAPPRQISVISEPLRGEPRQKPVDVPDMVLKDLYSQFRDKSLDSEDRILG